VEQSEKFHFAFVFSNAKRRQTQAAWYLELELGFEKLVTGFKVTTRRLARKSVGARFGPLCAL